MSSTIESLTKFLGAVPDPRVNDWFFMATPFPTIGIVLFYLLLVKKILPDYMANRPPYVLKNVIAAYNLIQVFGCCFLIHGILTSGWTTGHIFGCQCVDSSSQNKLSLRMAHYFWWTNVLKLFELFDTIFFCLRKKFNQVSWLHVYHHATSAGCGWIACKYSPGGMFAMTVLLNSCVHVMMYGYYYLSSLGPEMQKRLVWVKPRITQIQVLQLIIIAAHFTQSASPSCTCYSIWFPTIYVTNLIINIILFFNFYRKSYSKKNK